MDRPQIHDLGPRQPASRYLHALVEADVLRDVKVGREKLFLHPRLLTLLTRDGDAVAPFRDFTRGTQDRQGDMLQ